MLLGYFVVALSIFQSKTNTNRHFFSLKPNAQYNGNISSIQWQSGGDKTERSYSYTYDAVNRLLAADFNQKFSSGWGKTEGNFTIDYSVKMGDGINPTTAYDENGNIKQMQQWGLKLNTSVQMDNLAYNYYANSNKLKNIIDANNDTATTLGDFRSSKTYMVALGNNKTSAAIDYAYDSSGNAIKDLNKDIGDANVAGIEYNQFNLPWKITVKNKGTIIYIYDASGNKLEKITKEPASSINQNVAKEVHTTYLKGYIYVNNQLTLFGHEEGRIRKTTDSGQQTTGFVYDYFLKDHLGNIRTVLTDEQKQDIYPAATLENGATATEKSFYDIADGNIVSTPTGVTNYVNKYGGNSATDPCVNPNPTSNVTANSQKMYRLNGATGSKTGLGITLKVMAGDNVNILGKSFYRLNGTTPNNGYAVTSALSALINSFAGSVAVAGAHGATGGALNASSATTDGLTDWLNNDVPNPTNNSPKAYINWILLDEQFRPVKNNCGFSSVGDLLNDNSNVLISHLKNVDVSKCGYLYIYCSNESNVDVFFDNLQVVHTKGPLLEETHYYPFGLKMEAISSKAAGLLENKYKFTGKEIQEKEFSDGSGLEQYDIGARQYDMQTGMWHNVDPLSETSRRWSPYNYAYNNPLKYTDPDGRKPVMMTNDDPLLEQPHGDDGFDIGDFDAYMKGLMNKANGGKLYGDDAQNFISGLKCSLGFGGGGIRGFDGPTSLEAALMANYVYEGKGELIGGWQPSQLKIDGVLDKGDDGFIGQLFEKVADGKVIDYAYAFAGTQDLKLDGLTDLLQLGALSSQYYKAASNALNLAVLGVTFIGHSLGGGLAALAALVTDGFAITFNAAALSDKTMTKYNVDNANQSRIFSFAVRNDPLTNFQDSWNFLPGINRSQGTRYTISGFFYLNPIKYHLMSTVLLDLGY